MNNRNSACWEMVPREETDGRQRGEVKKIGSEEKKKTRAKWSNNVQFQ